MNCASADTVSARIVAVQSNRRVIVSVLFCPSSGELSAARSWGMAVRSTGHKSSEAPGNSPSASRRTPNSMAPQIARWPTQSARGVLLCRVIGVSCLWSLVVGLIAERRPSMAVGSALVALSRCGDLLLCAKHLFFAAMVDRRQETVVEGQTERGPGQRGMMARASVSRAD
jgi:hypothetical protein